MTRPDAIFFNLAFASYLLGFFSFVFFVGLKKEILGKLGTFFMFLGILPHTVAFALRWISQGHYPLASMYEFMGLMAWMVVIGLLYFVIRYKNPTIGIFMSPVTIMLLVTASLLPTDINRQLVPALQSGWLKVHVTMGAISSAAFMVASAAAWMYLVVKPKSEPREMSIIHRKILVMFIGMWIIVPIVISGVLNLLGWMPMAIGSLAESKAMGFGGKPVTTFFIGGSSPILIGKWAIGLGIGYLLAAISWPYVYKRKFKDKSELGFGAQFFATLVTGMLAAALLSGFLIKGGWMAITPSSYFKIFEFFGPTLVISWVTIPLAYYLFVLLKGGWVEKLNLQRPILEEVSFGAVAIGYPLYSVGALFAGAIWAEQAWGTWWSWDPKEVGALIIWLFYTVYLHARLYRGWKGEGAAVIVLLGMMMILVSFFGNYFFGGLHAFEVT